MSTTATATPAPFRKNQKVRYSAGRGHANGKFQKIDGDFAVLESPKGKLVRRRLQYVKPLPTTEPEATPAME